MSGVSSSSYFAAEGQARVEIDEMLTQGGRAVQEPDRANLGAGDCVAVREFVLDPPHGRAEYQLFVDRPGGGVIEWEAEVLTPTGLEWQCAKYLEGLADELPTGFRALPFV